MSATWWYRPVMALCLISNLALSIWHDGSFSWLVTGWIAGLWAASEMTSYRDRKMEREIEQEIQTLLGNFHTAINNPINDDQITMNFEENNNV